MAKSATWSPTGPSGSTAEAAGGWGPGRWERSYRLEQGAEGRPCHTPKVLGHFYEQLPRQSRPWGDVGERGLGTSEIPPCTGLQCTGRGIPSIPNTSRAQGQKNMRASEQRSEKGGGKKYNKVGEERRE